jgi:ABC-2 type transport system permease protein
MITQLLITPQASIVSIMSKHIIKGDIANYLSKPYTYPIAMYSNHLGGAFVNMLSTLVLFIPFGFIFAGVSSLSLKGVFFGIIAVFFALTLDFMISLSIGHIAFITEDAEPYQWIYGKILFVFGGLLFPLDIFGPTVQAIAKVLPPAFLLYYPASLFVNYSNELLIKVLLGQISYLAIFFVISYATYKFGIKRVSMNGG